MKKTVLVLMTALLLGLTGCAGFGDSRDGSNWYGIMGPETYNQHMNNELARQKLATMPTQTQITNGVSQGYLGIVANLSRRRVNFIIEGPEKTSLLLSAGETAEVYLTPGKYLATVYRGGKKIGNWKFSSSPRETRYMGKQVHWYVYVD